MLQFRTNVCQNVNLTAITFIDTAKNDNYYIPGEMRRREINGCDENILKMRRYRQITQTNRREKLVIACMFAWSICSMWSIKQTRQRIFIDCDIIINSAKYWSKRNKNWRMHLLTNYKVCVSTRQSAVFNIFRSTYVIASGLKMLLLQLSIVFSMCVFVNVIPTDSTTHYCITTNKTSNSNRPISN